ncbi:putative zinc metalloprotease EGY2, chloroplastic [Gracilariopsis chorda]|uniref:Putative zinc metalloprotease EGY2, chloroplastic n=1 Tax=Gracilariopsis chorda TaxID=448386 RepID=A0A2V3IP26_9FLOR|nr:putative zinc metalloprotease EGY2, chloroplastic [Gracilariopsis chorda]|eukprot:PXF43841.1 putative zinc metalloprotease EGY2, chloroplastic [Gracilariopsis chorda]
MNRPEFTTVSAYVVPNSLPSSWHVREAKKFKTSSPRTSLHPVWFSSSHKRRRPVPIHSRVICSVQDPQDHEKDKKSWFSGLKVWFPSKEKGESEGADRNEDGEGASSNGAVSNNTNKPQETSDVTNESTGEQDQGEEQSKRWPWQKKYTSDVALKNKTTEAQIWAKTQDSKLLRDTKQKPEAEAKQEQQKPTLQERLEKVTKIIAPGLNRERVQNSEKGSFDESSEEVNDKNMVHEDSYSDQNTKVRSSIRELYQPPPGIQTEQIPQKPDQTRWFRLPWKRKENQEEGTTFVEQSSGNNLDNTNQETPEAFPDRDASQEQKAEVDEKFDETFSVPEAKEEEKGEGDNESEDPEQKEEDVGTLPKNRDVEISPSLVDIMTIPQRDVAEIRLIFGSETFFATETVSMPGGLIFRGNLRGDPRAAISKLEGKLSKRLGDKYTLCLAEGEEDHRPVVVVVPTARDKRPAAPRQKLLAFIVAAMTASTCLGRGFFASVLKPNIRAMHGPPPRSGVLDRLFDLPFTTSLAVASFIGIIVIVAQIVQRLVATRHKTRVALPFFLPSYQLGTFGAVVQIASPTPSRSALFDIALAGMATMVAVSFVCLIIGLRMSTTFSTVVPVPMSVVSSSVIIGYLTQQVPNGKILVDYGRSLIGLHPLAVIGANCLTIAALNLLPIRQLDGGRIIGALYGRKTAMTASRVTMLFLLLASSKTPYFIMYLAAMSFGPWSIDRPSKDEITEPNAFRTIVGYVFMLLMLGILLPYPSCKFFGTA